MDPFTTKRTISRKRWLRTRFAFARTVELSRLAVQDKKFLKHYQAARDILLETLGPLTKHERRIVRNHVCDAAVDDDKYFGGNDFQNQADNLVRDLGISL